MVKTKEKKKATKEVGEGTKMKSKTKSVKKKELLDILRRSLANDNTEHVKSTPEKSQKKKKRKSSENETNDAQMEDAPTEAAPESSSVGDLEHLLYKPLPKKDRKVELDPRFQEIFTNPEYAGVTRETDERGARKLLKEPKKGKKGGKSPKSETEEEEEEEEESARSEAEVDSEDEETDLEEEFGLALDNSETAVWDRLEPAAVEFLEEATARLCLKNMQWDKVTPRDIFLLVHSFLPAEGQLHRVTIYPSEEGVAKIPIDEAAGPAIIGDLDSLAETEGVTAWPGEGQVKMKSLEELEVGLTAPKAKRLNLCRRYEIDRLGFFYAILDFDSPETANAVYEAIDGNEYESSGCRIDLYFVEDDRKVDRHLSGRPDEARWRAMVSVYPEEASAETSAAACEMERYAPPNFVNNALRHTHQFGLSWDETPTERKEWLESLAGVDDFDEEWQDNCPELARYVALSDSEEEEDEEEAAEKERKRQLMRDLLAEANSAERERKKRQMRGLKRADVSDSDSDDDDEEVEKEEEEEEEEEEGGESEEDMEVGSEGSVESEPGEADNFFKMVAEKRKEVVRPDTKGQKEKRREAASVGKGAKIAARAAAEEEEEGSGGEPSDLRPTISSGKRRAEGVEVAGKRKRKRLSKKQMAKLKLQEHPADPELSLLLSSLKRRTKAPKHVDSKEIAEDPRFAAILKDPKFAKESGSLVRLSARL